jgi:hypothetical protein
VDFVGCMVKTVPFCHGRELSIMIQKRNRTLLKFMLVWTAGKTFLLGTDE